MFLFATITIGIGAEPKSEPTLEDLFQAIRIVETGGEPDMGVGASGDNGKALGPYQIWVVYWKDAIEFEPAIGGKYGDCAQAEYSRKIMMAYFRRYGRSFLEAKDWESLARMHNGGPRGHLKEATLGYWGKVKRQLEQVAEE